MFLLNIVSHGCIMQRARLFAALKLFLVLYRQYRYPQFFFVPYVESGIHGYFIPVRGALIASLFPVLLASNRALLECYTGNMYKGYRRYLHSSLYSARTFVEMVLIKFTLVSRFIVQMQCEQHLTCDTPTEGSIV